MDSRGRGGGGYGIFEKLFSLSKITLPLHRFIKEFQKKTPAPYKFHSLPPRINRVFPLMIPFVVHIQIQDMKPNLIYNSILTIVMVNNYAKVRQAVIKQGTLSDCCTRLLQKLISPKLQFLPLCDEFIS